MTNTDTVSIDGFEYDAVTGLRKDEQAPRAPKTVSPPATTPKHVAATHLHITPQRSITLQRKLTKKPAAKHPLIQQTRPSGPRVMDIARHPDVRKFAPHPVEAVKVQSKSVDIGPVTHPHVAKAHAKSAAKARPLSASIPAAAEIKDQAVKTAIASTSKLPQLKSRLRPRQRVTGALAGIFALVLLGGYFTYLNMPTLSVRVAAAQAGIDANYPSYRPDGYALTGPVSFSDGRVSMDFKANGGSQEFTLNQSKSDWNNESVLDNYVQPRSGADYIPYTERGLTIYTYKNDAAWVNGGILYTVEGDAPLSSEQIRRIATSLL